jgi:hypothetical protein
VSNVVHKKSAYVVLRGESLSAINNDHDLSGWADTGYRVVHVVAIQRQASGVDVQPRVEVLLELQG